MTSKGLIGLLCVLITLSAVAILQPPPLTPIEPFLHAGGKSVVTDGRTNYIAEIPKKYWTKINSSRELQGRNIATLKAANNAPAFNREYLMEMLQLMAVEHYQKTGQNPTREELFKLWKGEDRDYQIRFEMFKLLEQKPPISFVPPPVSTRVVALPTRRYKMANGDEAEAEVPGSR